MLTLSLNLLGPFSVWVDDTPITRFRSDKVRALLAYLAVESGRSHRRESLAGLLWPDLPDQKALDNLRLSLHRLRAALYPDENRQSNLLFHTTTKTIQLNFDGQCQVDVVTFRTLLEETRTHSHPNLANCTACSRRLEQAVALYKGEFLAGFSLDSPLFEEWILVQRETLSNQALEAMYTLSEHAYLQADYALAQFYARQQIQIDAWREEAHYQLMRSLALDGQHTAALAQYAQCAALLEKELGVQPGDELHQLYNQILSGKLLQPVERALDSHPAVGFPTRLTPFFGRQAELAHVETALDHAHCRMLTLVGPGGVGKSRLAIQASRRQVGSWLHGVHFIPLAEVSTPDMLVPAIAYALRPSYAWQGDIKAQLIAYLKDKQTLLVLDNFEHLVESSFVLAEILERAPGVYLLVTSRQPTRLKDETVLTLGGLSFPADVAGKSWLELENYGAFALFHQIASGLGCQLQDRTEQWEAVLQICRLLDGLPLGIELAASWLKYFSPQEIAREIDKDQGFLADLSAVPDSRHTSLQVVFETSWKLLREGEQRVIDELSVFRGGFTLEAARHITGATPHLLSTLAEKSLLTRKSEGNFEMHDLLRRYAESRLALQPERLDAVRERHCAFYQAFTLQHQDILQQSLKQGQRPQAILDEFESHKDNLSASWNWLLHRPAKDIAAVESFVDGLGHFYRYLDRPQDSSRLYKTALDWRKEFCQPAGRRNDRDFRLQQANWEFQLGEAYLGMGRVEQGRAQVQLALRRLGRRIPTTRADFAVGILAQIVLQTGIRLGSLIRVSRRGSAPKEATLIAQAAFARMAKASYYSDQRLASMYYALRVLNLSGEMNGAPEKAATETNICMVVGLLGLHKLAGFYYRKARESAQHLQDAVTSAYVYQVTGIYDLGLGRWEEAKRALAFAAKIYEQMGYRSQWGECIMPQSIILASQGKTESFLALLDRLDEVSRENGDLLRQGWVMAGRAHVQLQRGETEAAITALKTYQEICEQVSYLPGQIMSKSLLAEAYLRQQEFVLARQTADSAVLDLSQSSHTVFTNIEAYSILAETYLCILEESSEISIEARKTIQRQALHVLKAMSIQTRGVPASRSRYLLNRGRYHWLFGAHQKAFKDWRNSAAEAQKANMPLVEGLSYYEAGRLLPEDHPQRQNYLNQAGEIFEQIEACYELQKVQAAKGK